MNILIKGSLFVCLILWSVTSYGQSTVSGEVTDMKCYLASGASGPDHAKCAKSCAKAGQPIGLLTDGGELYLLSIGKDKSQFETLVELAGENVEVTGEVSERNGVNLLVVGTAKKSGS
jgi:hypothetical protein